MAKLSTQDKLDVISNSWECRTSLDSFVDFRASSFSHIEVQLSGYDSDDLIQDEFGTKKEGGYTFIVWKKEAGQPEVVLNVAGFVMSSFFGPINRPVNVQKAFQNISIVGPGNETFHLALSASRRFYRLLEQSHPVGTMRPFRPSYILSEPSFTAEARFLTPAKKSRFPKAEHGIKDVQDPRGFLKQVVDSGEYYYSEDNEVEFRELHKDMTRNGMYSIDVLDDPSLIRPGHLVELSISFRTVTVGEVRPVQVFLVKLDWVMLINNIGSRLLSQRQDEEERRAEVVQTPSENISIPKKRQVESSIELFDFLDDEHVYSKPI